MLFRPFYRPSQTSKPTRAIAWVLALFPLMPDLLASFLIPIPFLFTIFSSDGRKRLAAFCRKRSALLLWAAAFTLTAILGILPCSAIGPTLLTAGLFVVCFLGMLGIAVNLQSENDLHAALFGLYGGVLLSSVLAILQAIHFATGMPFWNPFWVPLEKVVLDAIPFVEVDLTFTAERSTAAFTNSGVFGFYLVMSIPLCFYFMTRAAKTWRHRALSALPLLGACVSLAVTYSRMSYFAFLLVIFFLLCGYSVTHFQHLPAAKRILLGFALTLSIPVLCLLLALILPSAVTERFLSAFRTDNSINTRFAIWKASFWLLTKEPWRILTGFGTGVQNTWDQYRQVAFLKAQGKALIQPHAHNVYLQLLLEGGVLRLGSFLGLCASALISCRRAWLSGTRKGRYFTVALTGFFLAFLLNGLTDYVFVDPKICFFFFVGLGVLFALPAICFHEDSLQQKQSA